MPDPAGDPALEIRGLTKVFRPGRRDSVTAAHDLDLRLETGEVVGLLGPNGAGKTTIIKCALGLIRPTSGAIAIFGHDVQRDYRRAIERVSAVLEGARNTYWRLTPQENVRFFVGLQGLDFRTNRDYAERLLERFGLRDKGGEPLVNLSTGMKQKVAVVCALAKRTPLVFLDEPTLGLDVETSLELRGILRELAREDRRTIVVSSHDMDVIQDTCQRVVILKEGRIVVDDTVDRLLGLFRTRAYHLVLAKGLGEDVRRRLAAVVLGLTVERHVRQAQLSFTLPSADGLYEVIDLLRQGGAVIETITQKEPDLEEAFLRVIGRGQGPGDSAEGGEPG